MKLSLLSATLFVVAACGGTMPGDPGDDDPAPDAMPPPPPPPDAPPQPTCTVGIDDVIPAQLAVDTDDHFKLWVNGTLIDATERLWYEPQLYEVSIFRHPSRRNVIAVEGRNTANQDGRDRGLIADLRFTVDGEQRVVTDATWKVSATSSPGWETLAFADASWSPPFVLGTAGIDPWYQVMDAVAPGTTAAWLWAYDPNLPAVDKPDIDYTYARKTFSVVDPACE